MTARTAHPHTPRPGLEPPYDGPSRPIRWVQWGALAAVLVLVVGIGAVLLADRDDPAGPAEATDPAATAVTSQGPDGPITVGDGPVEVAVYLDYLCPACGAFEAANGEELDRLITEGAITLELRPISFLDDLSAGTEYSTRSANALATTVVESPEHVWAFHRALYAHQPAEGGPGLTDDELASVATDVGVPAKVAATFAERRYDDWVVERTERAFDDGITGTPTIVVDGEVFSGDPYTPGDLTAAVERAAP